MTTGGIKLGRVTQYKFTMSLFYLPPDVRIPTHWAMRTEESAIADTLEKGEIILESVEQVCGKAKGKLDSSDEICRGIKMKA